MDQDFIKKLEQLKPVNRCVCFDYKFIDMYEKTFTDLQSAGVGTKCGKCIEYIKQLINVKKPNKKT
jgi:hypothetical protein